MKNYWNSFMYGFRGAREDAKVIALAIMYISLGIVAVAFLFVIALLMVIASRFKFEWRDANAK